MLNFQPRAVAKLCAALRARFAMSVPVCEQHSMEKLSPTFICAKGYRVRPIGGGNELVIFIIYQCRNYTNMSTPQFKGGGHRGTDMCPPLCSGYMCARIRVIMLIRPHASPRPPNASLKFRNVCEFRGSWSGENHAFPTHYRNFSMSRPLLRWPW